MRYFLQLGENADWLGLLSTVGSRNLGTGYQWLWLCIYSYFNPRIVERSVEYRAPVNSGEVKGQETVNPNGDETDGLNQGEEAPANPVGEGSETANPPAAEDLDGEL